MPRTDGSFLSSLRAHPKRWISGLAVCSLGTIAACTSPGSTSSSTNRSTVASSLTLPSGYVRLTRNLHPLAKAELDTGVADPTKKAAGSIVLKLTPAQQADRDALLRAVQDPRSPSFHKWLTPDDYAARFGASRATLSAVSSFLASQGLSVDSPNRLANRVSFQGTRAQVERTFHAEMHDYLVGGKTHFALATAPAIPQELESSVLGIHGLHDFHKVSRRRRAPYSLRPEYDVKNTTALGPGDFATLYDTQSLLDSGNDGTGVTIAVVGQTAYPHSDITKYLQTFPDRNLTDNITDVLVPGTGDSAQNSDDDIGETDLDLEWASSVAPGANIVFVYTGSDTDNYSVDDAVAYILDQGTMLVPGTGTGGAQILSESYGGCDLAAGTDADLSGETASVANLEGITYLAASGDDGAAGCIGFGIGGLSVGPPASDPGVTGVGGTEFFAAAQASPFFVGPVAQQYPISNGVSLEAVWNDLTTNQKTSGGGGTGGPSSIFPKPFYQVGMTPADGARDVPDVSLTASPENVPYYTVEDGDPTPVGGTSAATPSFAGILALVTQAVATNGGPLGLGDVNPQLYALFKSNPEAFHDIVTGTNDAPCLVSDPTDYPDCPVGGTYGGYAAAVGYDRATGLGSVDAAKLVAAWSVQANTTTTVAASTTSTAVDTPITLSAHVSSAGTVTTAALTGTVSFNFQTYSGSAGAVYAGADGGFDESWTLGTATVTGTATGADVTLSTRIPPGLFGKAYVVAQYSGDATHLASVSGQTAITVTGANLAISPVTTTLHPNEQTTFKATGGAPPVLWFVEAPDPTCVVDQTTEMATCSQVESEDEVTGFFQAGPLAGTVHLIAVDTLGEETLATVTVAGLGVDAGTFPTFDAGPPGGPGNPAVPVTPTAPTVTVDAGVSETPDASVHASGSDAGKSSGSDDSGGCAVVGNGRSDSGRGSGSLLALVGLGVALVRRRTKK